MENAVEALKMAGSVLLFVLGLAVAILAFSQAKLAIDAVLQYSDRESSTIQMSEDELANPDISQEKKDYYTNIFNYVASAGNNSRAVGLDTIIPTIYRKFNEKYKIVFQFPDDYYLYENLDGKKITEISDNAVQGGSVDARTEFLNAILYREYRTNKADFINKNFSGIIKSMDDQPLYVQLKKYLNSGRTITEYLGMYDQNDENKNNDNSTSHIKSQANEKIQRVIIYEIK